VEVRRGFAFATVLTVEAPSFRQHCFAMRRNELWGVCHWQVTLAPARKCRCNSPMFENKTYSHEVHMSRLKHLAAKIDFHPSLCKTLVWLVNN
jgi:hypothetical protein